MAAKKTAKRTVKKAVTKTAKKSAKKGAKKASRKAAAPKIRDGIIAHTEFASADPMATKNWAKKTLGWKFGPSMPTPGGEYHMWDAGNRTGGGIRAPGPGETPGSIPYVEVASAKRAVDKAVKNGATVMMPAEKVPGDMGMIAIVMAPGKVLVGFWSPK